MSKDKLICEKCGTALWWRDEYIGKRVRCPICGHISAIIIEAQIANENETKEAKDAEKREEKREDDIFND